MSRNKKDRNKVAEMPAPASNETQTAPAVADPGGSATQATKETVAAADVSPICPFCHEKLSVDLARCDFSTNEVSRVYFCHMCKSMLGIELAGIKQPQIAGAPPGFDPTRNYRGRPS